jgi:hypothetical protein
MAEDEKEDTAPDMSWELSVESRLRRLGLVDVVEGFALVGIGAVSILALRGIGNLSKVLAGVAQATNSLSQIAWPQQVRGTVDPMATRRPGTVDETKTPPENDVAEPSYGPQSEPSEAVRQTILSDPVPPAALRDIAMREATDGSEPYVEPVNEQEYLEGSRKPSGTQLPGSNTSGA